jgi:hypothetical protein
MKNDYYMPKSDLGLTTCSMFMAISLVGLNIPAQLTANGVCGAEVRGAQGFSHVYYVPADQHLLHSEVLRRFAQTLLCDTQDNPQVVVDAMNRHFWGLV